MNRERKMSKPCVLITISLSCFLSLVAFSQQKDKRSSQRDRNNSDSLKIHSYLNKGKNFETDHPDSSLYYYQKAEAVAFAAKNGTLLGVCMAQHIQLLNHEAKFEDALALSQQHLVLGQQLKDSSLVLQASNEAANEYEYLGDYEPATKYYIAALKLAVGTGNKKMQRKLNNNLSSVFLALKDYSTGYIYSSRAYQMSEEDKDTVTMGNCLVNMAIAELNQKKYEKALLHLNEAEKIGYLIPDMTLVADALSDKGLVYLTTHKLIDAERSYQNQKFIADKYDLPYEKLYALFQLALVEKDKGNFNRSADFASRAISIGEKLGTADELMEMYDSMSSIKEKIGNPKTALFYKKKFELLNDSIQNEHVQTNIHHLNIQFRSAQKDKQIAVQNLKIETSRAAMERKNMWIFIALAGLISVTVMLILFLRNHRHKQKLNKQLVVTLQKEHEVNTLKAKMQAREEERDRIGREMHDDIGSALTTILYLCDDLKTDNRQVAAYSANKIGETAVDVVDKMNEIIWSMNPDYDTLDDLVAYTRQHSSQFLGDHGLRCRVETEGNIANLRLSGEQRRNIYLVIKEALHNSVKHASATEVTICFRLTDILQVDIHDNGKGWDHSKRFGNGLKNMRQRMEGIGGAFSILNHSGTTVKLKCPLARNIS